MLAVPVCRSTGHINRRRTLRHSREACPHGGGERESMGLYMTTDG